MRTIAGVIAAGALVGTTAVGCTSHPTPSTATSRSAAPASSSSSAPSPAQPQPVDYTRLLIQAADIDAPEIFMASPPVQNPNGQVGVATTFSNPAGTHRIDDTILVLPDPSAASSALEAAKATLSASLKGAPAPAQIGTGGTTASGSSADGSHSVTVLLFTEGSTLTTLEFEGPPGAVAPADFVTDVGQKQVTAIKNGLPG